MSGVDGLLLFVKRKPVGALGGLLLLTYAVVAVGAQYLAPYDPLAFHYDQTLAPPSRQFYFGTDNFGRDVLSRVVWGARTSMYVAVLAVIVGQLGGGLWGLFSAYRGGYFDMLSQRLVDIAMIFPSLVLALMIVSIRGSSLTNVVVAISIAQAPAAVRTIRSAAFSVKESLYVEAARAIGCNDLRIIRSHILPNCTAPLLVLGAASLGTAILAEASLSFLGMGVPPPNPSWGAMLSGDGRTFMERAPWMVIFPGIAISTAVLAFNLLGDAVRDFWDPRLQAR